MERSAFRAALTATVPVMTGYFCLGFAYGLLMVSQGFSPLWPVLMSLVVYGGSIQFLALSLLGSAFAPAAAFLLSFMVNARHIFYGLSMLEPYRGAGWARLPLIALLTDETFSVVSATRAPDGAPEKSYRLWVSVLDYGYWVGATALGALFGKVVHINTAGMDFALTALFVVLFLEQWKKKENRFSGAVGIGCAALALAVFGAENMVIPAMIAILAVLWVRRKRT